MDDRETCILRQCDGYQGDIYACSGSVMDDRAMLVHFGANDDRETYTV